MSTRRRLSLLVAVWIVMTPPRIVQGEPFVGVYYYPWYGNFAGGHSLNQSLRGHLVPAQPPALGLYSSRDAAIIGMCTAERPGMIVLDTGFGLRLLAEPEGEPLPRIC